MQVQGQNDSESLPKNYKRTLVVILLIILIAIPIIQMVISWGLWSIIGYYSEKIANTTGMNHYLAKAIVLIFMAPLALSFKWSFAINPFKWKTGLVILICYTFIFNISMFLVTKEQKFDFATGKAIKYYAKTPEGIRYYDGPGFDPKYGIPFKPVDPGVIRKEILRQNPVKKIQGKTQYFDNITGEPLCYYFQSAAGIIEIYDQPGFHPIYGTQLKPITQEIVVKYEEQLNKNKVKQSNAPHDLQDIPVLSFSKGYEVEDLGNQRLRVKKGGQVKYKFCVRKNKYPTEKWLLNFAMFAENATPGGKKEEVIFQINGTSQENFFSLGWVPDEQKKIRGNIAIKPNAIIEGCENDFSFDALTGPIIVEGPIRVIHRK